MILLKQILFVMFFMMCPLITYAGSGIDQILIPSGEYSLGSLYCKEEQGNADWCKDESPRKIKLDSFRIDKYEVSNAEYTKFTRATNHRKPAFWEDKTLNFSDHPVVGVNWSDAMANAKWKGGRLPTEAEW